MFLQLDSLKAKRLYYLPFTGGLLRLVAVLASGCAAGNVHRSPMVGCRPRDHVHALPVESSQLLQSSCGMLSLVMSPLG